MFKKKDSRSLGNLIRYLMHSSTLFTIMMFALIVTVLLSIVIRPLAQLGSQLVAHSIMREMMSPVFPQDHGIKRLEDLTVGTPGWENWKQAIDRQEETAYRLPFIDGNEPLKYDEGREMPRHVHTVDIIINIGDRELFRSGTLPPAKGQAEDAMEEDTWLLRYFSKPYLAELSGPNGNEIGMVITRIYPPLLVSIVAVTAILMLLLGILCFGVNYWLGRWLVTPMIRSLQQLRDQFQKLADGKVTELFERGLQMEKPYLEIREIAAEASRIIDNTKMYMERLQEQNEELKAQKEELLLHATTDGLTGLLNRRHFLDLVGTQLSAARFDASLLLLDIDDFKRINDEYGHIAGDQVLIGFSLTLQKAFADGGLVGRFGGEEFAVFLTETDEDRCLEAAERLRVMVANHRICCTTGEQISVTTSIGLAHTKRKDVRFEELYQHADAALYLSKKDGKNRITLGEPLTENASAPE